MLPLPRRRVDPEELRDRLRALASGVPRPPAAQGLATVEQSLEEGPGEPPAAPWSSPRAPLRAVVVAVAATAVAAWLVVRLTSGGTPSALELVPGSALPSAPGVLAPASGASSPVATGDAATPAERVVVQVVGQVRRPGLVTLPLGSRVADAVAAAGGLVRGGSSGGLNLARVLVDGEQVVVSPDVVPAPGSTGPAGGGGSAVVDLNAATVADLDALPGVGPVMAARILDWRAAHGRFTSVDQLREVSGIGARTFERLKPHVRV